MNGSSVEATAPLFVPAAEDRRYERALADPGQTVILDLEDAVADERKTAAREWVAARDRGRRHRTWVRVNGVSTGRCREDVLAAAEVADVVVLPKCDTAEHVREVGDLLDATGHPTVLVAMVETASGLARVVELAHARTPRLRRLFLGLGDLAFELGLPRATAVLADHARVQVAVASRAARLSPPLDSPSLALRDAHGVAEQARAARNLGFTGKACVHPAQVAPVREAFAPPVAEVRAARRIHEAFLEALAGSTGAVAVDGELVDYANAIAAEALLVRAGVPHTPIPRHRGVGP